MIASTRPIATGSLRFVIATDEPGVVRRLNHLLAGFPDADGPSATTVVVTLERRRDASGAPTDLFDTRVDGEAVAEAMSLGDQEFRISRVLNERKLDAEPELLHLHSAAVARGRDALVLVGRSGAGKSTLAAALVRDGWEYLTDEIVAVNPIDHQIIAYPRPITLRKGVWPCFPELAPFPDDQRTENQGARMEVSPLDLGAVADSAPRRVVGIVFPRFARDEPTGLQPVGNAAETVDRLASCCYDLERLGPAGVQLLAGMAARGANWELDYSDLAAAVRALDSAFARGADAEHLWVRHVPAAVSGTLTPGTVRRQTDAHAWSFEDGSAVVYRPSKLQLGRIDSAGLRAWEHLDQPLTLDVLAADLEEEDEERRADLAHWLERMIVTGFVEAADEGTSA